MLFQAANKVAMPVQIAALTHTMKARLFRSLHSASDLIVFGFSGVDSLLGATRSLA
jgi:hypothetical protein